MAGYAILSCRAFSAVLTGVCSRLVPSRLPVTESFTRMAIPSCWTATKSTFPRRTAGMPKSGSPDTQTLCVVCCYRVIY